MSTKLNLIPELPVFIGQSILFLTNIFVVKKLFIDPYLSLKEGRLKATTGSQEEALKLIADAQIIATAIDQSMAGVFLETTTMKSQKRALANEKKAEIVGLAEGVLRQEMLSFKEELTQEIALKRSQLSSIIDKLTQDAVAKMVQ